MSLQRGNGAEQLSQLAEHFGSAVPFSVTELSVDVPPRSESLAERDERKQKEALDALRAGAMEHPAIESAQRILGGEVKEVIPLTPIDESPEIH